VKLPVVFQHYIEHKQEDKNISMFAFLYMHYLCGSPKDKDYERDMQLPFKSSSFCITATVADFVPSTVQLSLLKPVEINQKKLYGYFITSIPSSSIAPIWQPPKSC
jgi:hypothetical protein